MSSGGLSRRRVPASSASASTLSADDLASGSSSPTSTSGGWGGGTPSNGGAGNGNSAHAGSALEGGSKVAFDPRDLDEQDAKEGPGGGKMPRLTIMEEVLLLGLKDKQVRVSVQ